jgi:tellurite methyltransferase
MRKNWDHFYQITKDRPPSTGLIRAVALAERAGHALDLGCGAGRDTRYLLEQGFRVTAIDKEAAAIAILEQIPTKHLSCIQSTIEDFAFAQYDLINAHFALPFISQDRFSTVFARLKTALKPQGIFVGQFLGIHDSWNIQTNHGITFFTHEQALAELQNLDIITFEEEEIDGQTHEGKAKHWHIYHIIARQHL